MNNEECHKIAISYLQTKNLELFWKLVEYFRSYIMMFATFIKTGNISNGALYRNTGINMLCRWIAGEKLALKDVGPLLQSIIGNRYESKEELFNELCLIFKHVTDIYTEREGPKFHGYIEGAFPGSLKNWIIHVQKHEHSILKTTPIHLFLNEDVHSIIVANSMVQSVSFDFLTDYQNELIDFKVLDDIPIKELSIMYNKPLKTIRRELAEIQQLIIDHYDVKIIRGEKLVQIYDNNGKEKTLSLTELVSYEPK